MQSLKRSWDQILFVLITPDSYLYPRFDPQPAICLLWTLWFSSIPLGKCCHDYFHILTDSSFIIMIPFNVV